MRVSCTDGCTCDEHTINAHSAEKKESIEILDEFSANVALPSKESSTAMATEGAEDGGGGEGDGGSCVLRLEVLDQTASSGAGKG